MASDTFTRVANSPEDPMKHPVSSYVFIPLELYHFLLTNNFIYLTLLL